jgi:hypothetical protein
VIDSYRTIFGTMQHISEARILAHVVDRTRQYTRFHLGLLKEQDPHREFVCEGKTLNTVYWLVAHLATTQNGLLLHGTGGPFEKFSWAKHYTLGGRGLPAHQRPPYAEVWTTFKQVHERVMAHLPTLSDEQLEAPNRTGLTAIGSTTRDLITHAVRHEALHTGHLSWLCKLYGIPTM